MSEAFEVLSDAQKRAVYDRHGAAGLSGGVPTGPDGSTFRYNPSSADDVFEVRVLRCVR